MQGIVLAAKQYSARSFLLVKVDNRLIFLKKKSEKDHGLNSRKWASFTEISCGFSQYLKQTRDFTSH
jgi:hypothetical protein